MTLNDESENILYSLTQNQKSLKLHILRLNIFFKIKNKLRKRRHFLNGTTMSYMNNQKFFIL